MGRHAPVEPDRLVQIDQRLIVRFLVSPDPHPTETITLHYMGDSDDQSSTGTYNPKNDCVRIAPRRRLS
jgi:hypothetical protein